MVEVETQVGNMQQKDLFQGHSFVVFARKSHTGGFIGLSNIWQVGIGTPKDVNYALLMFVKK